MEPITDRFMFFYTFWEAIELLPENERANACYQFCKYALTDELPKDKTLAMFCIGVRASVHKFQKRGGNHNPCGKNQYTKNDTQDRSKEVKEVKEVKLVKTGQTGQTGQKRQTETETETETETKTETKKKVYEKKFFPPSLDECKDYAESIGCFRILGKDFYNYYTLSDWKDKTGKQIKNWKQKMYQWYMHDTQKYYNDIPPPHAVTEEEMKNFKRAEPLRVIKEAADVNH